jgi:LmbE family N-acetylglucosaminyl deacetylase
MHLPRRLASSVCALLLVAVPIAAQDTPPAAPRGPERGTGRTLLAVFAHPDDEATVSAVLGKYAAEGVTVYLAIATDGRLGVTKHAAIPGGDALAAVRSAELKCAAEKLGIEPPIAFGLHDQLRMGEGQAALQEQLRVLRDNVTKLFTTLKPDVVLTWGASGWTGHQDHRLVGSVVTEVFQSQAWGKPSQLYFAGVPTGSLPAGSPMQLGTVDPQYLTVRVAVSEADYERAKASWLCHKSQYTPETIEGMHQLLKASLKGTTYFQPLIAGQKEQSSLFEGEAP